MSALAGLVSKTGVRIEAPSLKAMCDSMAHRGPDDVGYVFFSPGRRSGGAGGHYSRFTEPEFHSRNQHIAPFGGPYFADTCRKVHFSLGMGHRRLAVIDLSVAGHQPMVTADRRYWITFNGTVYNFPALRAELLERGHRFYGHSDTEVLLYLWEEYGDSCLTRLDGMFALAVYDLRENILTLARDRFGAKPLYYAEHGDVFAYASEIKGLLASGAIPSRIDPAALREYFTFQNIYSNRTLIDGVRLLEPGETLRIRPGCNEAPERRFFHFSFPSIDPAMQGGPVLEKTIAETFISAVRAQLVSDVDIGAYLSGGMDSGSVVAVAGRGIPRLTTFTCGFDVTNVSGIEQGFDERGVSEQLAYLLQTEHYEVVLHAGDMPAAMEKISWHVDDPRVGMCHQNWYAAKLASKFVKVCLSGTGGDELFGGYPWRYLCGINDSLAASQDKYFLHWHRFLPPRQLAELFSPDLRHLAEHPRQAFDEVFAKCPAETPDLSFVENALQRIFHFEFRSFLHGVLLIDDKISMAHGLEVRTPFLSNALADLAFRIPASCKLNLAQMTSNGGSGTFKADEGKMVLRRSMRSFLPEQYVTQPKQGFSPPDGNWYRGESMEYIKEILYDTRTRQRPWFNQKTVNACLEEHFAGQRNHRLLIWSLLSFEWLQRHFCEGGPC